MAVPGADQPGREEAAQEKVGAAAALARSACQFRREVVPQPQAPEQAAVLREGRGTGRAELAAAILPQRDTEAAVLPEQAVKAGALAVAGLWVAYQVFLAASGRARGVR